MDFATPGHALEFSTELINSAGPISTLGRLQERPTRGSQEGYDHAINMAYTVSAEWAALAREIRVSALTLKASHGVAESSEARELFNAMAHWIGLHWPRLNAQCLDRIASLAVLQYRKGIEGEAPVPMAQYAKAVGITRQSASEPRWAEPIRGAERHVAMHYRSASKAMSDRLRDVGIVVRRY